MLEFVKAVNEWMWGLILLIILCGTGIFFTIRLKFIQVRKFGEGCRLVFGHFKSSGGERKEGEMTPFQSIATAIAAQVGTGNLAGAATALIGGGPGAIFWMWVSAFLGMATIYAEAVLAQTYKTEVNGEVTGGLSTTSRRRSRAHLEKCSPLCSRYLLFLLWALWETWFSPIPSGQRLWKHFRYSMWNFRR